MNQSFPVKDLLRRRFQTSLTIATLTLSVASTLFLLLFSSRIGVGISASTGTLTLGLTAILLQFIVFVGVLIFVVGAILTSFIIFLMMAQRTRDFGLIKAAGCPNALVAGYFITELLIVVAIGTVLGLIFGFAADFAVANVVFHAYALPNWLFAPIVFATFFVLALVFGIKPIIKAAQISPINALSPVSFYGIVNEKRHNPLSRSAITLKIATRSLSRRLSSSIRIVILLSVVFILLTVSIAGGIIARDTTNSWVQEPANTNTLFVAHNSLGEEYLQLLSTFSSGENSGEFNFSSPDLAVSEAVIQQLRTVAGVANVDERLILKAHVKEISNFTISPDTATTYSVGDKREGDSIIIGLNPSNLEVSRLLKGRFLSDSGEAEAVIGDSIANTMYLPDAAKRIVYSDPLVQSIKIYDTTFRIVGVRLDPLNNGNITYVPLRMLQSVSGIANCNIVMITPEDNINQAALTAEIQEKIKAINPDLHVFSLKETMQANLDFLGSTWAVIMLLPLLTLASAAMCLVGYTILTVDEQHQEFGVLRAIGTKPRIVVSILSIQSIIVLLSSFGFGISLGTITTLMILMPNPLVTGTTVLLIAAWLLSALAAMFLLSLYPAFKLSKTPILKILA
jgi:ABC-type antimicrobial peptide transport system permease subunit